MSDRDPIIPAVELPPAPDGFVWANVSAYDSDREGWFYTARARSEETGQLETVAELEGCYFFPVPATSDAGEPFLQDQVRRIRNEEGELVKIEGVAGAAAKIAYPRHEEIRGLVREGKIKSPEGLQDALARFWQDQGPAVVEQDKLDELEGEALADYLRSVGINVK